MSSDFPPHNLDLRRSVSRPLMAWNGCHVNAATRRGRNIDSFKSDTKLVNDRCRGVGYNLSINTKHGRNEGVNTCGFGTHVFGRTGTNGVVRKVPAQNFRTVRKCVVQMRIFMPVLLSLLYLCLASLSLSVARTTGGYFCVHP